MATHEPPPNSSRRRASPTKTPPSHLPSPPMDSGDFERFGLILDSMDNKIEDNLCIHVWSLKHESLLERDLENGPKPISLWYLIHCVDGRKWQRADLRFMVSLAPESSPRPGSAGVTDYKNFRITWRPPNDQERFALFTAINTPRRIGKNVGMRWWFLCPMCGERVAALYFKKPLGCRECCHLVYKSESFSRKQRACMRASRSE